MPVQLPMLSAAPVDEFTCVLDGTLYGFRVVWNGRAERWTLTLQDASGSDILTSSPILGDAPILEDARDNAPPGRFLVVDTEGVGTPPGRDELGARVVVLYYTAEEVADGVEVEA